MEVRTLSDTNIAISNYVNQQDPSLLNQEVKAETIQNTKSYTTIPTTILTRTTRTTMTMTITTTTTTITTTTATIKSTFQIHLLLTQF